MSLVCLGFTFLASLDSEFGSSIKSNPTLVYFVARTQSILINMQVAIH